MAVLALGLVGAGLTSAIGIGASIGWMGGVVLGNLLFGSNKGSNTEGSRLSDLSVQTSTYGGTIQLVYGTMRVSGNVIWSTPLKETRHVSRQSGGKGGGGSATTTTYILAPSTLRQELATKGTQRLSLFSWKSSATGLLEVLASGGNGQ